MRKSTDKNTKSSQQIKKQQQRHLLIAIFILVIIFIVVYGLLLRKHNHANKNQLTTLRFSAPMSNEAVDDAWLEQFQSKMKINQQKTKLLQKQLSTLKNKKPSDAKTLSLQKKYQQLQKSLLQMQTKLKQLQENQKQSITNNSTPTNNTTIGASEFPRIPTTNSSFNSKNQLAIPQIAEQGEDVLQLTPKTVLHPHIPLKNPKTYVPAGTHVLGVLLMGADVSSSDYNQQNPQPILIRLIVNGTLPNHYHSHLKGCVITGAMTGDLSASRGNVRLERLSCVRANHAIIDVPVFGTVASQAKQGIAGQIYTREGKRVAGAMIAGLASGLAKGVSNSYVNYQDTPYGQTGRVSGAGIWKHGAWQGVSSGLKNYSDFAMSRAEQIHPIIQVNGGKLVTVVFLHGFYLAKA